MRPFHVVTFVGWLGGLAVPLAMAEARPSSSDTVALVGGVPISDAEFRTAAGNRLVLVENQAYQARQGLLDELIERRLLEAEAARRGLGVEALLREEVDEKTPPVSDEELAKVRSDNQERLVGIPEAEVAAGLRKALLEKHSGERKRAFVSELRRKAHVRILWEPPRVAIRETDSPSLGPKDAPVTVVEFSDFQCPYCAQAVSVVKKMREIYGEQVRVVYRDFPLEIHKDANRAAEAGACARDQGKFWEMHDRMFADPSQLGIDGLKASAKAIGLDVAAFGGCLDSGRHKADWQADSQEGTGYGVSGTPFFFVNGRMISGVVSLDTFRNVIDQELERTSVNVGPNGATR